MKSRKKVIYILRLISRYFIAFQMFSYASAKILKTQFNIGVSDLDENISTFNGFELTWFYYGYSRTYGLIIACVQIAAALFLLFRKTERIGVILFLSFMVNILLVDIFYKIDGAIGMAGLLTILGIFLLLSDWKGFTYYFLKKDSPIELNPSTLQNRFKKYYWIKFIIIPIMAITAYTAIYSLRDKYMAKSDLYGFWRNASGHRSYKIHKIFIDYNNRLKIKDFDRNVYYGRFAIDTDNSTINLNAQHYGDEAYYFIQDSVQKLGTDTSDEKIKNNIRTYYNTLNNSLPFENESFKYELIGDTLYLKTNTQETIKFVEVSKDYLKK